MEVDETRESVRIELAGHSVSCVRWHAGFDHPCILVGSESLHTAFSICKLGRDMEVVSRCQSDGYALDIEPVENGALAAMSSGKVSLFWIDPSSLDVSHKFDLDIDGCSNPVASISTYEGTFACGSEGGFLSLGRIQDIGEVVGRNVDIAAITGVDFRDSNSVLCCSRSGCLRLVDSRCESSTILASHSSSLECLGLYSDDKFTVAAGCDDGRVALWDLRNPSSSLREFNLESGTVWDITFSPVLSRSLVAACDDGKLCKITLQQTKEWSAASDKESVVYEGKDSVLGVDWLRIDEEDVFALALGNGSVVVVRECI